QLEAHFTGIRRSGLSKWEHISKNIVELKEDLAKKEKKLKDLHEFSENLIAVNFEAKLENDSYVNNNLNKLASQINLMISEKDNILKKLEEKELEIKDLNNKLREAKSKEPKVTISSGALKITAPKRAANVDAKDFIDFTGRGFGKY
ncbi:MAG: hypothetical protein FWF50_00045, partial [Defluviitaleaceae bacterium]|nr:hypothetical protein [Defluviitaleaceae bacterium]